MDVHHDHNHAFAAYSFEPSCCAEYFQQNADAISGAEFGCVLRVKGFLRSESGAWMRVDYVPGELRVTEADDSQNLSPRLVFIGAGLNEDAIAKAYSKRE